MFIEQHPVSFVLASTNYGPLIVSRNDYALINGVPAYGVGYSLLESATYDPLEAGFLMSLLHLQRQLLGDGVVFLDCGANIGVFTIEAARAMTYWGRVYAFEPQDFIYYALAGNVALNNLFNVEAHQLALGASDSTITIPRVNYCSPGSYGSLEIKDSVSNRFLSVGQDLDFSSEHGRTVRQVRIDSFKYPRVDLIKIDVESMEAEVLAGAVKTIKFCQPIVFVETLKSDISVIRGMLSHYGYHFFELGKDMLALPPNEELLKRFVLNEQGELVISV